MLNSSVMLGNYLQQTTSADDNLRCILFLGAKVNISYLIEQASISGKMKKVNK